MGIPHYHPGPECFCDRPDGVVAPVRDAGVQLYIPLTEEDLRAAAEMLAAAADPNDWAGHVPTHEEHTEESA